jgi:hypothetical protein
LTAEKWNSCNSEGSGYLQGPCQALTCVDGYELFEGACREVKRVESVLTVYPEFKTAVPVTAVCLKANIVGDTPGPASCGQLPRMLQIMQIPLPVTIKAKSGACNVLSLEFRQQFVDGRESSISTSNLKGVQVSKRGPNSFEIVDFNGTSPRVLKIKGDGKANFTLENSKFECDDSAGSNLPDVSPNQNISEPPLPPVIDNDGLTLSDCGTEKAVEDPDAIFSNQLKLRAGDDIAPFINSFSPYTQVKVGALYFDANTANFVCQLHGYLGGVATQRGSFYSPGDNFIYRWEPKTKQLQGVNAAAVGNSTITAYTCKGKLIDICKKDPSWIFKQLP